MCWNTDGSATNMPAANSCDCALLHACVVATFGAVGLAGFQGME
jgi:hypothetical protein